MDNIKTYRMFCIQAFKDGKIIPEERDFLDNQARRLQLSDPEKKKIENEIFTNINNRPDNFEEYRQQAIAIFRKEKVTQEERALLDILGVNYNLTKEQQKLIEDKILQEQKGVEIAKGKNKEEIPKKYTNCIGMQFALILAGEFMMGSEEVSTAKPVHKMTIRRPFYIGIYPVTQREWKAVMGNNPSYFKGDDLPIEQVSWNDVQEFIKKLNEREGGNRYRLPSEAEWEYSARAGTTTIYSFGDDESKLGEYAWYNANSGSRTHEVGQKKPNPWGLYDMHGNVWEWVQDKMHINYDGALNDGNIWEGDDSCRVIRGGGYSRGPIDCLSTTRGFCVPDLRDSCLGFRIAFSGKVAMEMEFLNMKTCNICHGNGGKSGTFPEICSSCSGSGEVTKTQHTPFGPFATTSRCQTCCGTGTIKDSLCNACHGSGYVLREIEDRLKKEAFEKLITIKIRSTFDPYNEMLMEIDIFNAFEGTMDYLGLDFSDAQNDLILENNIIEFSQLKSKKHVVHHINIIPFFLEEDDLTFSLKIRSSYGNIIKNISIHVEKTEKMHDEVVKNQLPKDRDIDDWLVHIDELERRFGVEGLIRFIKSDSHSRRIEAIEALGVICDERAVNPLITVLDDEDVTVRQLAVIALGNIGDKRAVLPLIVLLEDHDLDVRLFTIHALGNIGDCEAVDHLIAALKDDDVNVRMKIIGSLGMIRDKKAFKPLINALREDVDELREKIIWALGEIRDKKAVNSLLPFLGDIDLQNATAIALGKIGDIRALDPLIHALEDENVRDAAAIALGKIGDNKAVDPLIHALEDEDNVSIIEALSRIGDKRAIDPLIRVLHNENVDMRLHAAEGLGKMRDEGVVKQLLLALEDDDVVVRCRIVEALGKIRDKRAVVPLISALDDDSWEVRLHSIEALGMIGDTKAIPALEKVQKNPEKSREDQQAVVKALINIKYVQEMERKKPVLDINLLKNSGFKVGSWERLLIKVSNSGQSTAKNVIVCLSGKQIDCHDKKKTIEQLQAGDSFDIEFNVKPIDPGSIIVNFEIQYEHYLGKLNNTEEKRIEVTELREQSQGFKIDIHGNVNTGNQFIDSIVQRANIGGGVSVCPSCGRVVKNNEKSCPGCSARVN